MINESAKPKVGYVLKCFPRISETFILNEILELERQGIEVEIFSLNPPGDPRFHGDLGRLKAEVQYLPRPDSSKMWRELQDLSQAAAWSPNSMGEALSQSLQQGNSEGARPLLQALWIAAHARRQGVHHLHAHFATLASKVAMMAHKVSGIPFSLTAHAKDIHHQAADPGLIVDVLRHCRFAVTVTDYNVRVLSQLCIAESGKIRRIYNGLPLDLYPDAGDDAPRQGEILAVGRLVEKKGFPYLLAACRLLKDRNIDFRCRIIGRGPLEEELAQRIERLGLTESVSLLGAASHRTVLEAMRRSTLVTLPCIVADDGDRDALPTVLLEAMALSRPVVSTQMEGVNEIVVPEQTGLLVPQRDAAALAGSLARLLGDRTLQLSLAREGRERVAKLFDIRRNAGRLAQLFADSVPRRRVIQMRVRREVVR